jgi:hypothetical protein
VVTREKGGFLSVLQSSLSTGAEPDPRLAEVRGGGGEGGGGQTRDVWLVGSCKLWRSWVLVVFWSKSSIGVSTVSLRQQQQQQQQQHTCQYSMRAVLALT